VAYLYSVIGQSLENMTEDEKEEFCTIMAEIVLMNVRLRRSRDE
jgi:hypothetical protein